MVKRASRYCCGTTGRLANRNEYGYKVSERAENCIRTGYWREDTILDISEDWLIKFAK